MEQPLSLSAEHIRIEKVKLLQSIQPLQLDNLLVGQYTENSKNPGYLGEWGDGTISDKSTITETYAAAVLMINNPRWSGVPFILKAGKVSTNSYFILILIPYTLITCLFVHSLARSEYASPFPNAILTLP